MLNQIAQSLMLSTIALVPTFAVLADRAIAAPANVPTEYLMIRIDRPIIDLQPVSSPATLPAIAQTSKPQPSSPQTVQPAAAPHPSETESNSLISAQPVLTDVIINVNPVA